MTAAAATADACVIGAGVIGASVAYHLACRGLRVVVVDRAGRAGEGSTGRATGGFRAQFDTEIDVRLSLLARGELARFAGDTGVDPGYWPVGYLWLATGEAELERLRAALRVQHAAGLAEAREVAAADVSEINPAVAAGAHTGGAFCPTDGFIRPLAILDGYLRAATRLGAEVWWDTEALAVDRDPLALRTSRGTVSAPLFVNAAGAWARGVGRLFGAEVPVDPLARAVLPTAPTDVLPAAMPMTLWLSDGFHLRVRDGRVLLLRPTPTIDEGWIDATVARAHACVPALAGVPIDRAGAWTGLYEMSPDGHALLGPAPDCPELLLVNGSSGHGVMHAPALGRLAAEIVCDGRATSLEVSALRPDRTTMVGPAIL